LDYYENKSLTKEELYEAKQLLKVLDDLVDEGYTELNKDLESKFKCVSRLRKIIKNYNDQPFEIRKCLENKQEYSSEEHNIDNIISGLINEAKICQCNGYNDFLDDIYKYSEWIDYDNDTAYIFLLRDTLLPYVYFKSRNRKNIYPYIISRSFIRDITGEEDVDDEISLSIYEALESGITTYEEFDEFCKEYILKVLSKHSKLKDSPTTLLTSIKQKKIMVIESGYMGTIPMLLSSLDNRVDFRLYTTIPYLFEIYKDKIYCKRYEDVRKFETLYSQDVYIKYSSFIDGIFNVKTCNDNNIKKKALEEICRFL